MKPTKKQLVIGGVAVVVVLAVVVWIAIKRKTNNPIEQIEDDNNKITPSVEPSKRNLDTNGVILVAQNLLNAMNRYGTDEQSIVENLKLCTKDDLLAVIKEFGVKPYNGVGLATTWFDRKVASTDQNLNGWLKSELKASMRSQVAEIFKNLNVPF